RSAGGALFQSLTTPSGKDDSVAFTDERARYDSANPAARTGNESNFAVCVLAHGVFLRASNRGGFRRPDCSGRGRPRSRKVYVPSDHPARYSSCSGVSLSILMFIDSSFNFATRLSSSSGTL